MEIILDDLTNERTLRLIAIHLNGMEQNSPPESIHALGVEKLRVNDITFYSAWEGEEIMGCGALKELTPTHGEVKSMRTTENYLRNGVARAILQHIVNEAKIRGYKTLSLETGSMKAFTPAHKLYESFGFNYCGPFATYKENLNSVFMSLAL